MIRIGDLAEKRCLGRQVQGHSIAVPMRVARIRISWVELNAIFRVDERRAVRSQVVDDDARVVIMEPVLSVLLLRYVTVRLAG